MKLIRIQISVCLGQLPGIPLNSGEYSGIITAVGSNMTDKFKPGDRICAASNRVYGNRVRTIGHGAHKIPDDITFETAATIPFIYVTVHFSFVTVGRLQKGESVLIHSAAGGVGQVAVMYAKYIGATVFVTVGNERKKKLIMENFGLPESHIFSSRTTSFAQGIKRLTSGRGVDVILNSLSGEMFRETCKCLAPRGRFVEIGKKDILLNTRMDMARLDGNRTYSSLDLTSIFKNDPEAYQRALASCMSLLPDGSLTTVKPISTWPITDVELAFREIQTGKHSGKLVLTTDPDCTVKVCH
jgi:emericellamide synthase (highly reducing iterative type I polyketide synthase)